MALSRWPTECIGCSAPKEALRVLGRVEAGEQGGWPPEDIEIYQCAECGGGFDSTDLPKPLPPRTPAADLLRLNPQLAAELRQIPAARADETGRV